MSISVAQIGWSKAFFDRRLNPRCVGLLLLSPLALAQDVFFEVLHQFNPWPEGRSPSGALVQGAEGSLYGATAEDMVFKLDADGLLTKIQSCDAQIGANVLIRGEDGSFYGTTSHGGINGLGTIFRLDSEGVCTVLHAFGGSDGHHPSSFIEGAEGRLYGTTSNGGSTGFGIVFELDPQRGYSIVHSFQGEDGVGPSSLALGPDGSIYGTTGGDFEHASTIFKLEWNGAFAFGTLHVFEATHGDGAKNLILGNDGSLYGITHSGGTIFKLDSSGAFTTLHTFGESDGWCPRSLVRLADGTLYGTSGGCGGGSTQGGTIFKLDSNGVFTTLHFFDGSFDTIDGCDPNRLIVGADGSFYGTTSGHSLTGSSGCGVGTIFKVDPNGDFTTLYSFRPVGGAGPNNLVQDAAGDLYGTTSAGGSGAPRDNGTIFKLDSRRVLKTVLTLESANQPAPNTLLSGPNGSLYWAGAGIFKLDENGLTTLHAFDNGPPTGLIQGDDGGICGILSGCSNEKEYTGMVFRLENEADFSVLHSFPPSGVDGWCPWALVKTADGRVYGTTSRGGEYDGGTIFRLDSGGTFVTVHSFEGPGGGYMASLALAADGNLYGTSLSPGTEGAGSIFRLGADNAFTTLHSFPRDETGSGVEPNSLIRGADGNFYGLTQCRNGCAYGAGSIFKLGSDGAPITLHSFDGRDGAQPARLIQGLDGSFYGITTGGGLGYGVIFRLTLGPPPAGFQVPGDANHDSQLDLSDAIWLLGHLFLGTNPTLPCEGGAASSPGPGELKLLDHNGDGTIDLSDAVAALGFLFSSGTPPALGTACTTIAGCPNACEGP